MLTSLWLSSSSSRSGDAIDRYCPLFWDFCDCVSRIIFDNAEACCLESDDDVPSSRSSGETGSDTSAIASGRVDSVEVLGAFKESVSVSLNVEMVRLLPLLSEPVADASS